MFLEVRPNCFEVGTTATVSRSMGSLSLAFAKHYLLCPNLPVGFGMTRVRGVSG